MTSPPAVGETKECAFQWVFSLAPGVAEPPRLGPVDLPNPLDLNTDPPGTVTAAVKFTNLGDNPVLSGPMLLVGTWRLPAVQGSPLVTNLLVEVATPYSNCFRVATVVAPA